MTINAEIERNPEWMPHDINLDRRTVEFLRVPSTQLLRSGFLFDYEPACAADLANIAFSDVVAMNPVRAPLHFIFHSAFCRSSLLTRALNLPAVSDGLNEPAIFAALIKAREANAPLIRPILRLLARPRDRQQIVFAKPTNHANRLIPALLDAAPSAKGILITNDVPQFLESVHRRGLFGKRWGRELYLEMQGYAGIDLQMNARETFLLTDMQSAGLAWLLNQNFFQALTKSAYGHRLRIVDGDWFNNHRMETLQAVLEFVGVQFSKEQVIAATHGSAFATHSKLGGDYNQEPDVPTLLEKPEHHEIPQVRQWLMEIARQLAVHFPLQQTL